MTGKRPEITRDMVAERLSGLVIEKAAPSTPTEVAYRAAAAVVPSFTPAELHPAGVEADQGALADLLDVCQPVYGGGGLRWRLPDDLRRETFEQLDGRALAESVAAAATTDQGPVQRMLSAYVTHSAPPLPAQSYEDLLATAQVTEWLHGIVDGVPESADVRAGLETAELLAPLRRLVGTSFQGRADVLERLHDYADILPADGRLKGARRHLRRFRRLRDNPPLVLHGPGGVGKSTVLAKFILDHVEAEQPVPFVYIDFDRPGMLPHEPLTLLVDAVRQLGVQYPAVRRKADELRAAWLERLTRPDFRLLSSAVIDPPDRTEGSATVPDSIRLRSPVTARRPFYVEFAALVRDLVSDAPLLFALDTFETVQRFGEDTVHEVLEFLDGLQSELPSLRVVLAGRAPVTGYPTQPVPLEGFDDEAARGFLASLHDGRLAADTELLEHIVRSAGRSPLNLRLAADLVVNHGPEELRDIDRRRVLFVRVRGEQVQGWLYRRILDRIGDRDVRALAHPGLVVRRLTPAVIRHVLAEPCDVAVPDDARAYELFDACSREVSLLSWTTDGALEHRADIRREMLPVLRRSEPDRVAAIHARAVRHYQRHDELAARAEEMYHRLCLVESAPELDRRWQPGIEAFLAMSLEELPAQSQVYLASRIGVTLPPNVLFKAERQERERYVTTRVRQLISYGELDTALTILRGEPDRSHGSPLDLLEARVLEELGRLGEADEVLSRASQRAAEAADADALFELNYSTARLAEARGQTGRALSLLELARSTGGRSGDPLMPLRLATAECRLLRNGAATGIAGYGGEAVSAVRRRLLSTVDATPAGQVATDPALLTELAGEAGEERPDLVMLALVHVGLPDPRPEEADALGLALAAWDGRNRHAPAKKLRLDVHGREDPASWRRWLDRTARTRVAKDLVAVLDRHPGAQGVVSVIAGIYRRSMTDPRPSQDAR